MEARLVIRYEHSRDDDDFGWLTADVTTAKASGRGGYWVQWQDVEEWAAELAALPLRSDARSEADWGYLESESGNYHAMVKVVISAAPTGPLEAVVKLGDHIHDRIGCRTVFETGYPEVQRFAAALMAVMRREAEEAVLTGRNLD
jgi:hypothetical protein